MDLKDIPEAQLDLIYFALKQAVLAASAQGTDLPFIVTDGPGGRELTWLEDVSQADDIDHRQAAAVVCHRRTDDGAPAIVVVSTTKEHPEPVTVAQVYRLGGNPRRFTPLSKPFPMESVSA